MDIATYRPTRTLWAGLVKRKTCWHFHVLAMSLSDILCEYLTGEKSFLLIVQLALYYSGMYCTWFYIVFNRPAVLRTNPQPNNLIRWTKGSLYRSTCDSVVVCGNSLTLGISSYLLLLYGWAIHQIKEGWNNGMIGWCDYRMMIWLNDGWKWLKMAKNGYNGGYGVKYGRSTCKFQSFCISGA